MKTFSDKALADISFDFDITKVSHETCECEALTLWIPIEYKVKFNEIQARSRKKFGKFMKKMIIDTIDRVIAEAPPSESDKAS